MSNIVLNWKYKKTNDDVLDYIASVSFDNREDIANDLGISVKTVGRRINKLKEEGLLVIHRYKNNNFIYMVGEDAKMDWDKYQARHIAIYRMYKFDPEEIDADDSMEMPLFDDEIEEEKKDDGYHFSNVIGFTPESKRKQTVFNSRELDCVVDGLISDIKKEMRHE